MSDSRHSADLPLEERVDDLLSRLTLEEKISLMAGAEAFALAAVPRLDIPAVRMTDGPTGVRSNTGETATVFPVGVAIAASWNPDLTREVAAAIAREARALGEQVVLAPTINIVRTPVWGRNFETYSEDPHLTAQLGIGYVEGLQSEGVGASLKHYAVNNQEYNRLSVSAEVDERTLREVYLSAFEAVVKTADPWTVMASYNKVNGIHASENPYLLTEILKHEWGYDGVVVSDWGAVHSTAPAANAGLDLEMPGPPRHFGAKLSDAVKGGEVDAAQIDDSARRVLRLIFRCGLMDAKPRPKGEIGSPRHQEIARRAAREAIVLLKNEDGLLPLDAKTIRSLAVIGPNADVNRVQGDGSSRVHAARRTTPLQSLRALLGSDVDIRYVDGADSEPTPPLARARLFSPAETRTENGLTVEYFATADFASEPYRTVVERRLAKWVYTNAGQTASFAALRWRGCFWPAKDGRHEISIRGDGATRVTLDGHELIGPETSGVEDNVHPTSGPALRCTAAIELKAGRAYPIVMEYVWAPARANAGFETVTIGVREPTAAIAEAVAAAQRADAAIVIVGSASTTESEGYDRPNIELPGNQNALVEAVLAANPRTIVVLNSGAAMTMPWIARAKAVLAMWLPGEEGPDALAEILFGNAAPSGRLPITFPKRLEDNPAHNFYPGDSTVSYGEGLFVGYRHYDREEIAPLFAFGHGLTYTTFAYSELSVPEIARIGETVVARVTLTNTGARRGMETVQIYVEPRRPPVLRPIKELKAFAKVDLAAGESRTVEFALPPRAFSFYDPQRKAWIVEPGAYDILAAASANDIRLRGTLTFSAR